MLIAQPLVERDRCLVVRKHVELELVHADPPRPVLGLHHEGRSRAEAAMVAVDHQADIRDVIARGMRVARDREAADDRPVRFRNEDGRVRVAPDRAQVAALFPRGTPLTARDQPAFLLAPNVARQLN
jgi:hypothetical protein